MSCQSIALPNASTPEPKPRAHNESYAALLARLSARSVTKHFDAYADVDWDDPSHVVVATDPRFELAADEPLAGTSWYQALPAEDRARLGLDLVVGKLKLGIEFESILSRGLLEFASTLPNGSPEFRYAYHEVIEEGQHALMFQELINRSGLNPQGLGSIDRAFARRVPRLGRSFPTCFFLCVLAGEAPIDRLQRALLASGTELHPLLRRVMQIHVIEEARHLCFATRYLEEHVPMLGPWTTARLRLRAPIILGTTAATMMRIPDTVIRAHRIPRRVVREAYASASHRERISEGVRPVRALCERLDLIHPSTEFLWSLLGIGARLPVLA